MKTLALLAYLEAVWKYNKKHKKKLKYKNLRSK
jgi:hypothetical protein